LSAGGFRLERSTCGFLAETAPRRAATSTARATAAAACLRDIAAAGLSPDGLLAAAAKREGFLVVPGWR
jgi:hypothetical protein